MAHGGARVGSGRPKMTKAEKLAAEKGRMGVLDLSDAPEIPATPPEWLDSRGKSIYTKTRAWLLEMDCLKGILPALLEEYAHLKSKWHECEDQVRSVGMVIKDDKKVRNNPFVTLAQSYRRQANEAWQQIFNIVRETKVRQIDEFESMGLEDDPMLKLLRGRP